MTVLPYIFNTVFQLLILFLAIVISRRLIVTLLKSRNDHKKYLYLFNILVYFVWIVFVMLKIAHALNDNYIIVGSTVFLLVMLMWDYLSNFFLGIIFAFQYGFLKGQNIIINKRQGKLIKYSSSYFELLTNKGEKLKVKFKEVYKGDFEIFSGALYRVSRKIKVDNAKESKAVSAAIMNHPLFLMNGNFHFYDEVDEKGVYWLCFYFHVMNNKDATIINSFINQFKPLK